MSQKATAIIPARLGSTRFPGKALADETGTPMVVHVCERAALAESVGRVVVATDAQAITDAVRGGGFEAVLTGEHKNGTSRVAEAARLLGLKANTVIVNVQGDEPEIDPGVIDAAVLSLGVSTVIDRAADVTAGGGERFQWVGTVASPFSETEDPVNPNIVKVVVGLIEPESGVAPALYFSRSPVPYDRDGVGVRQFKHVGVYAYSLGSLLKYMELLPTPLEHAERLEQLRWLEHGYPIAVAVRETSHHGIDTPEQYADFVKRWRGGSKKTHTPA